MKYKYNNQWKEMNFKVSDTLPIGSIIDYNGETAPTGWEEVNSYSTSEVKTGDTWIDGKPIYRKVLNVTSPTFNDYVNHNIANIDVITNAVFMAKQGTDTYRPLAIVFQDSGTISPRFSISLYLLNRTQYFIAAGSYYTENIANMNLIITIEYTKTTD